MTVLIVKILLLIAFLFGVYRLYAGPELADRIIALDALSSIVAAFILLQLFITGNSIYIDIVLVISLVVFLGTIAITIHLRQKK
ncbi:MAG: hypothetical protein GVY19_09190 [Bacteroidetes bacterium]|jgi:multisubunit Na+/H+ antiporter MnhF subunit|nr:hypothetical protein [Bacteroidota bacterium]